MRLTKEQIESELSWMKKCLIESKEGGNLATASRMETAIASMEMALLSLTQVNEITTLETRLAEMAAELDRLEASVGGAVLDAKIAGELYVLAAKNFRMYRGWHTELSKQFSTVTQQKDEFKRVLIEISQSTYEEETSGGRRLVRNSTNDALMAQEVLALIQKQESFVMSGYGDSAFGECAEDTRKFADTSKLYVMVSEGFMVGIDDSSGGYPWKAKSINSPDSLYGVRFWNEKQLDEAECYMAHWHGKGGVCSDICLKEFKFLVEE